MYGECVCVCVCGWVSVCVGECVCGECVGAEREGESVCERLQLL